MQLQWNEQWLEFQKRSSFSVFLSLPEHDQLLQIKATKAPEHASMLEVTGMPFRHPGPMCLIDRSLYLAGQIEILRMMDVFTPGRFEDNLFDACFVPSQLWFVSELGLCDVGKMADGKPLFASSKYSCLATVDEYNSFAPVWKPDWISALGSDTSTGLSGMAMQGTQPTHVSCFAASAQSDPVFGAGQGVLVDMPTGEIVCANLHRPVLPRWHRGVLYLAEQGSGVFGRVNCVSGEFERIACCPGLISAVSFISDYAIVATSALSNSHAGFDDSLLRENCSALGLEPRCGLSVINLKTGERFEGISLAEDITRIAGMAILANRTQPHVVSIASPDLGQFTTGGAFQSIFH